MAIISILMRQILLMGTVNMNNIIVVNGIVKDYVDEYIEISSNNILFKKNGSYNIYYEDCTCCNLKFIIMDNVCVNLFSYMIDLKVINNIVYELNDNSCINLFKFYANKEILENEVINLNGYMSRVNYNFSNICTGRETYNYVVNHNNSNSKSDLNNRSICLENASVDFDIDANVAKGNVKCDVNQDTKIVNLGENHSLIKPKMTIDEEDVIARHASVIGNFRDDELFYLMSRGIDYSNSVKLLVKGYIFSNLSLDMEKRNQILTVINRYWR